MLCRTWLGYHKRAKAHILDAVYADFSSAFHSQSVNHQLLLHKLQHMYGIEGPALR